MKLELFISYPEGDLCCRLAGSSGPALRDFNYATHKPMASRYKFVITEVSSWVSAARYVADGVVGMNEAGVIVVKVSQGLWFNLSTLEKAPIPLRFWSVKWHLGEDA